MLYIAEVNLETIIMELFEIGNFSNFISNSFAFVEARNIKPQRDYI